MSLPDKETEVCDVCGDTMVTDIPFISKDFMGWESAECKCGDSIAVAVGRTPEKVAEMKSMFQTFDESLRN